MNTETSALWLLVAIVASSIGMAMFVYAIRQKDPLSLVFAIAFSLAPMLVRGGWSSATVTLAIGGLFIFMRKR